MIGKSVETALLAHIAAEARASRASALSAEFLDSGRNQVASTFLANHGFTQIEGERWLRSLDTPGPRWPEWIEAVRSDAPDAASVNRTGATR